MIYSIGYGTKSTQMVLQIITYGVVEGIFLQIGLNEEFVHYFCYF